jgi:hypothetical protein
MKSRHPVDPSHLHADGDISLREWDTGLERRRPRRGTGERGALRKPSGRPRLAAVTKSDDQLRAPSTATEYVEYEYKDHVLRVERQRVGWKAAIYPKGSPFALPGSPYTPEIGGRNAVLERAKAIVDSMSANENLRSVTTGPVEGLGRPTPTLRARLLRFWTAAKNVYFSVDQPRRGN